MTENYMQDANVKKYFDRWINTPTPLGHPSDTRRFYQFVKACVDYAGHPNLSRKLSIHSLKLSLYDALHDKYPETAYENLVNEIVILFEHLIDYEDTVYP